MTQLKNKKDTSILDIPRNKWKLKENKLWLEIRGISTDGKADEIKERVNEYMTMNTPPAIITTEYESIENILLLVNLLTEMIGIIMSASTLYDEIDYIELLIRKFLNYYNLLDKEITNNNELPTWMTQYNFLCLLNIPNIMRRYGCCRNIWEGSNEGEGFLRKYKREIKNGLKHNWQIWTINNLLQRNVFNKEQIDNKKKWKQILVSECNVYRSKASLDIIINNGQPISGLYNNVTNKIIVTFRENKLLKYNELNIDWLCYEWYCNMKYFMITNDSNKLKMNKEIVKHSTGCLLLPKLQIINDGTQFQYCIVCSDWRKI